MSLLLICLAMLSVQDSSWSEEPPEALVRMEAYRNALRTGVVKNSYERTKDSIEYETLRRVFRYETSSFAGDDAISVDRGDAGGIVHRNIEGEPMPYAKDVYYCLRRGKEVWSHREADDIAELGDQPARLGAVDARTLGISFGYSYGDLDDTIWRDRVRQPSARKYQEASENGLHVVTAESDVGTIRWWIDADKGWSPVRVALYRDGEVIAQSRSVLKQFDGVWYPETVQYYLKGQRDGKEPMIIVKVLSAEFNRPEHPQRFTPEDIGIVPRETMVEKYDQSENIVAAGMYDPEEDRFMTPAELMARRQARRGGDAEAAPTDRDSGDTPTWTRTEYETEWEAYTRRFIETYKLNDDQTQKAWTICHNCQQRARDYVAGRKDRFERLDNRLADARHTSDTKKTKQIEGELAGLMRPVSKIFETQLKPRLDKLPTRAQRKTAKEKTKP